MKQNASVQPQQSEPHSILLASVDCLIRFLLSKCVECRMDSGLPGCAIMRTNTAPLAARPIIDCIANGFGPTPSIVPGAKTICTKELFALLSYGKLLLIDTALYSCGRSLPGAIGLQGLGQGASFSDSIETRFRHKLHELTNGDLSAPIVVYCANSERFSSYNLALRLVTIGYAKVYWYRGGWEAWQVAGLPEAPIELQSW